jgi:hypothetical protein
MFWWERGWNILYYWIIWGVLRLWISWTLLCCQEHSAFDSLSLYYLESHLKPFPFVFLWGLGSAPENFLIINFSFWTHRFCCFHFLEFRFRNLSRWDLRFLDKSTGILILPMSFHLLKKCCAVIIGKWDVL